MRKQKKSSVNTENGMSWWSIYPTESMQTNKKDRMGAGASVTSELMVLYSVSKKQLAKSSGATIITLCWPSFE